MRSSFLSPGSPAGIEPDVDPCQPPFHGTKSHGATHQNPLEPEWRQAARSRQPEYSLPSEIPPLMGALPKSTLGSLLIHGIQFSLEPLMDLFPKRLELSREQAIVD